MRDWPIPSRKKRYIYDHRSWLMTAPAVATTPAKNAFFPTPVRKRGITPFTAQRSLTSSPILIPIVDRTITELPLPRRLLSNVGVTRAAYMTVTTATPKVMQGVTPNPWTKKYIIATISTTPSPDSGDVPFAQRNYPNPLLTRQQTNQWINYIVGATALGPFFQNAQPNPVLAKKMALHWDYNLLQNTLEPPPAEVPPLFMTVAEVPLRARGKALSWINYITSESEELIPIIPVGWPNPRLKGVRHVLHDEPDEKE
jgi:hypothetical protein